MDKTPLVNRRLEAGLRLLRRLAADRFDVYVAFWARLTEENQWYFFISTKVADTGPALAYSKLMNSLRLLQGIPISFADIKIIGESHPGAVEAKKLLDEYGHLTKIEYLQINDRRIGDIPTRQCYIYKKVEPKERVLAKPEAAVISILLQSLFRGPNANQTVKIGLNDGSSIEGILTALHLESGVKAFAQFIEAGAGKPRLVDVKEITSVTFEDGNLHQGQMPNLSFLGE